MHIILSIPENSKTLSLEVDESQPLQTYPWNEIIAANILCDASVIVSVTCMKYNDQTLDCSHCACDLNLPHDAQIIAEIEYKSIHDTTDSCKVNEPEVIFFSETKQSETQHESEIDPIPFPESNNS